jgi:hypothetical protein
MSYIEKEFSRLVEALGIKEFKRPPSYYVYLLAEKKNLSIVEGVFAEPLAIFEMGVGKSVYCLKTLYNIYNKNWDIAKRYIVFTPQDFLKIIDDAIQKNYRIPALVWDDAGFWVGRQRWQNKFVIAVREFLNVIRTHIVLLMINAPSFYELARGIRERLRFVTFIRVYSYRDDVMKMRSLAKLYHIHQVEAIAKRNDQPHYASSYSEHISNTILNI